MSLSETVQHFRRVYQAAHQELPHREEYERLAEDAFKACSEWFGPPLDPDRRYSLRVSPDETSACGYFLHEYLIYLAPGLDAPEERCENIGHEMYHRGTMRRPGLRTEPWIDEMMAFLASEWFLRRHGYHDHARANRRRFVVSRTPVDMDALRRFRINRQIVVTRSRREYYPETFYPDVRRVATALNYVVPAGELCRLPWSPSLTDWIVSLPADSRACVGRLLGLADRGRPSPQTPEWNAKMGYALQILGRHDEAGDRFRSALGQDAGRSGLCFEIGLCLEMAGHLDDAHAAYHEALRHDDKSEWPAYNLANIHWAKADYAEAAGWYREALRRKPDWPEALYYLGTALIRDSRTDEAEPILLHLSKMGDQRYAAAARQCLGDLQGHKQAANPQD